MAQQVGVAALKSVSLLPKDTELLHVCARVCLRLCVKPLKSFMQRFSFRLPKQRVKIVASTRCCCCCQLLWLLVAVVVVVLGYSTAAAAAVQSHCQEQQQTVKEAAEAEEECSAHLFKLNKQPPFLCFPPFVCPSLFLSSFFCCFRSFSSSFFTPY